jgi:hypothetical protein
MASETRTGETPPERLFRDSAGAALERAARLEDENKRLRHEVERLKRPGRDAVTVRTRPNIAPYLAFTTVMIASAVGALMAMSLGDSPRRIAAPVVLRHQLPPAPPAAIGPEVGDDCTSAFTYAEDGTKRYKPECLATVIGASPTDPNDCVVPYWYDVRGVKRYKQQCLRR